jgi:peptide/nickel transport system substrate-binding protein
MLAESWRFLDPTTVEIKLRQGVKFQNVPPVNGRELVADDVLFSWRRLLDRVPLPVADAMTSMEALDRYTIQIKTKAPQPLLIPDGLFAFRGAAIVAREAADQEGRYDKRENIIGTGPFILTEYTPGVGHVAKRNPDYWVKGRPYLDGLRIPIMRDQSTRIAALLVGKLDFMEDIELNEREGLVGRKADVRLVDCDGSSTSAILVRNDLSPFSDVRVRRALSMALDREGLVTGLFQGKGSVIALAPGSVPGALKPGEVPPEVRKYLQYNPTEAKKLLAEAGYPNGLDVEILGTLERGTIVSNTLQALPGLLKPGGFNVKLKVVSLVGYNEGSINRNYGVAGLYTHSAIPIETSFLANLHSKGARNINRVAANDPVLDKLIEQMLVTIDPAERLKVVHQIQIRIVDQMPLIVFPTGLDTYGASRRLQGDLRVNNYTINLHRNLLFQDIWVTN